MEQAIDFLDTIWPLEDKQLVGMATPPLDEVEQLNRYGIHAVVSLRDEKTNLDAYDAAQIPFLWLPTKGGTAPSVAAVDQFIEFVNSCFAQDLTVAVHCSSGRKRTGTLLAAYLVRARGMTAEQAIAKLAVANPLVQLSKLQQDFLVSLQS